MILPPRLPRATSCLLLLHSTSQLLSDRLPCLDGAPGGGEEDSTHNCDGRAMLGLESNRHHLRCHHRRWRCRRCPQYQQVHQQEWITHKDPEIIQDNVGQCFSILVYI